MMLAGVDSRIQRERAKDRIWVAPFLAQPTCDDLVRHLSANDGSLFPQPCAEIVAAGASASRGA